ncbi:hypothetical protein GF325_05900, partial [Candidatus Bathyarchaeota archaeon]|nr:hypothetical protein [Candidatus Bathyarchaeota archaeon]
AAVKDVLKRDGQVLIPAFGVARSQEIIAILQSYGLTQQNNIVVDGMAREISRVLLKDPNSLRTPYTLNRLHLINRYKSRSERNHALRKANIIIAPSGMLKGGTVRFYAPPLLQEEKNGIFLVSYQVEGTPGRILLEEGTYDDFDYAESKRSDEPPPITTLEAKATVEQFDFSSHCDGNDLLAFLSSLEYSNGNGEVPILCVHGDRDNCEFLSNKINNEMEGVQAFATELEDEFRI